MSPSRAKVVEQIALNVREQRLRTIAFVSTRYDRDTSALIGDVAEVLARANVRSLVAGVGDGQTAGGWSPLMTDPPEVNDSGRGFDFVRADMQPAARAAFNDPESVRRGFLSAFSNYEIIILDLPGLIDENPHYPNAVAVSTACDGVILVCPTGEIAEDEIRRALALVRDAGGRLCGTVMNDRSNPTIATDLRRLRSSRRSFIRLLPKRFLNWLERRQSLQSQIYS